MPAETIPVLDLSFVIDPVFWANAASVATVLSALTLITGAWVWWTSRSAIKTVNFGWDLIGVAKVGRLPRRACHTFEIRNSGSGRAYILALDVVEGQIVPSSTHRARKTLGSGDSFTLLITAKDIHAAWFRVMWREEADENKAYVNWGWVAPSPRTESGTKIERSAPSGASKRTIRGREESYKERERWMRERSLMHSSAFPGSDNTPNLPFIGNVKEHRQSTARTGHNA